MLNLAINGFGRIGRQAFKVAFGRKGAKVIGINDLTDTKTLAHLLKYDTAYGKYDKQVSFDEKNIIVDGEKIPVFAEKDPSALPWAKLKVDVVLECTGRFTDKTGAELHLKAGAKKVVISAPAKGGDVPTYVRAVNCAKCKTEESTVINNASCTTNSIGPVMAVLNEKFGIEKAMMTTAHGYTADQNLQDGPHRDLRRARAAAENIVPTTTGAAIAVTEVIPAISGVFDGLALRVPVPTVSVSDMTVLLKKDVTKEEINQAMIDASKTDRFAGVLTTTTEQLVSSDFIGDTHSAIVDLSLTNVVGGNLVKVVAWYDNETGYANRLVEIAELYTS
ncbi:MAG: type I glyceraldehyde-3-phosphate dehydrogenase [Candidatus Magasanikbacteria bacterium RIFOXYD2_FULL_39_9]|uniref:Glyceraldehyde-3-phosphate dehydrogenase n=1 Tax=Candidatus Magasanikbacteria bacterium RIFOXYD1_FULL_40_23 TaxID=1798705 RepID=A0A1F6P819_9BACT|nr:MAG: type I glyceraldehyde-3-phosphate dehydrogenase [Candidatus Magasanikbacteria bacterium RIFOXYD1_FULL_40_23]OGH92987.1 MAG: type I glyceraldehyde-3-phosphate dehydrogenase [Candidatus Magasanikbacteria bacterium RIFOXYD2_FULL_39_9]